jgi:hypothetical protein
VSKSRRSKKNRPATGQDVPEGRPASSESPGPDESAGHVWTWICIPTFLYCLGLYIKTQTSQFKPVELIVESKEVAAIAGLFAAPIILVCIALARGYANERPGYPLARRLPPPTEKWPRGVTADRMRIVVVLGVLTIIVGSQVHFLEQVLQGPVYPYGADTPIATKWKQMLTVWPSGGCCGDKFRFGEPKGWTYWPALESWIFLSLVVAVVVLFLTYLFKDLRIHKYVALGAEHIRRVAEGERSESS